MAAIGGTHHSNLEYAWMLERRREALKIAEKIDDNLDQIRALGCRAKIYSVDNFKPEDSHWVHLIGTDEQIAASFFKHNDPAQMVSVEKIRSLGLDEPLITMMTNIGGTICEWKVTADLCNAIQKFDKRSFEAISDEQKQALCAEELYPHELEKRLKKARALIAPQAPLPPQP